MSQSFISSPDHKTSHNVKTPPKVQGHIPAHEKVFRTGVVAFVGPGYQDPIWAACELFCLLEEYYPVDLFFIDI